MREGIVCAPGARICKGGWSEPGVFSGVALKGWGERGEMTRLKFRQLVCSGHNPGMEALKILRLKVAQVISSSGLFPGEGDMHDRVVLGTEWNIVVFLFFFFLIVFHVGVLSMYCLVERLGLNILKEDFKVSLLPCILGLGRYITEISDISSRRNGTVIFNKFLIALFLVQ